MKRFRFSLEKVLKLRVQETEAAKRALAQAMFAEDAARAQVQAVADAIAVRTGEAQALERGGMTAFAFGAMRTYLTFLQKELAAAEDRLLAAREQVNRRRADLMDARKREKAIERLKDHRLEQYQLESLREEQKELDEYGNRQGLNGSR